MTKKKQREIGTQGPVGRKPKTPELENFVSFLNAFRKETDRGAALLATALLEERLHEVISAFMADEETANRLHKGPAAPLSTFSAKIACAYALDLIDAAERNQMDRIRDIRNDFAHRWRSASFNDQSIKDRVALLPWGGPEEYERVATVRGRFDTAVVMLLVRLLYRVHYVAKERRRHRQWTQDGPLTDSGSP